VSDLVLGAGTHSEGYDSSPLQHVRRADRTARQTGPEGHARLGRWL